MLPFISFMIVRTVWNSKAVVYEPEKLTWLNGLGSFLMVFSLSDLTYYTGHRIVHRFPILFNFIHKVATQPPNHPTTQPLTCPPNHHATAQRFDHPPTSTTHPLTHPPMIHPAPPRRGAADPRLGGHVQRAPHRLFLHWLHDLAYVVALALPGGLGPHLRHRCLPLDQLGTT